MHAGVRNNFENIFFKLLNNSVLGKTCENLTVNEDLVVIRRLKAQLTLNKPIDFVTL